MAPQKLAGFEKCVAPVLVSRDETGEGPSHRRPTFEAIAQFRRVASLARAETNLSSDQSAALRSPCRNPESGASNPRPNAIALKSSPISAGETSFCTAADCGR